ncbi:MAG: hypothetical protein DRI46_10045 [Chloroflexi bacterium]|nr:MAG: hypothetical protein DRI46_10045 [Chloroflexota bacterium]
MGVDFLRKRAITGYTYIVQTALRRDANIGQSVRLVYEKVVAGESQWTVDEHLWVRKFSNTATAADGIRYTTYELGTNFHPPLSDGNTAAAQRIKKIGGGGASGGSVVLIGGSPGAPGIVDHGLTIGLNHDDHPHYLLANGARDLTGNLAVSAGITIDGVDISAHASDVDAHHDEVTVAGSTPGGGLTISEQALSLTLHHGDGLAATMNTIDIDLLANSGLAFSSEKLTMGVPSTIGSTTLNEVVGSAHSHLVYAVSNAVTTPGFILKSDADGRLAVSGIGVNTIPSADRLEVASELYFIGSQDIETSANNLRLFPAADLVIEPQGDVIWIGSTGNQAIMKSADWSSGFMGAGWGMSYDGHLDARSAYLEELHVTTFTMEQARVKTGQDFITQSGSYLTADFTVPAVGASRTMTVEDANGLSGMAIFGKNDYILLMPVDRSGAGILIAKIWGQVAGYVNNGDGTQSWTWTTRTLGLASANIIAKEGSVAVDFGQSGDGWINMTAIDQAGSPYIGLGRWTDNPYTAANIENPVRLGDLGGITGDRGLMGLFIGDAAGPHFIASEERIEAHGMAMSLYSGNQANTGYIRVNAIEVNVDYGAGTSSLRPTVDVTSGTDEQGKPWLDNLYYSSGAVGESLIDDDPNSPNTGDYIRNKLYSEGATGEKAHSSVATFDLGNISGSFTATEQIQIQAHVTVNVDADTKMRLVAEIQDNTGPDYAPHTREVTLANQDTASGLVTVYVKLLEVLSEGDWNGARLRLHWYITPTNIDSETIRLDPNIPSIAAGSPLPLTHDTGGEGFIVYDDGGTFKMRVGGTSLTGGGALVWDGSELYFRDGDGGKVITLDSGSGKSYFSGTMFIEGSGEIRSGATSGIPYFDEDGYNFELRGSTAHLMTQGFIFRNYQDEIVGGMYGYDGADNIIYLWSEPDGNSFGSNGEIQIMARGLSSGGGQARVLLQTGQTALADMGLDLFNSGVASTTYTKLTAPVFRVTGDVAIGSGLYVGSSDMEDPNSGQLILDQGSGDGKILSLRSSDYDDVSGNSAMDTDEWFYIQKYNGDSAGAVIKGAGDATRGIYMIGTAETAHSATGRTAIAPIILSGRVDNTSVGDANNAVILGSGTIMRWILKGDGEVHNDYSSSMAVYDKEDDMQLISAVANTLGGDIIQNEWEDFLMYNADDLERLGIVKKNGFVSQQNMTKLLIGGFRQLNTSMLKTFESMASRIAKLEAHIHGNN